MSHLSHFMWHLIKPLYLWSLQLWKIIPDTTNLVSRNLLISFENLHCYNVTSFLNAEQSNWILIISITDLFSLHSRKPLNPSQSLSTFKKMFCYKIQDNCSPHSFRLFEILDNIIITYLLLLGVSYRILQLHHRSCPGVLVDQMQNRTLW